MTKTSIDVTMPVLNEEHSLPRCIETLTGHLAERVDEE